MDLHRTEKFPISNKISNTWGRVQDFVEKNHPNKAEQGHRVPTPALKYCPHSPLIPLSPYLKLNRLAKHTNKASICLQLSLLGGGGAAPFLPRLDNGNSSSRASANNELNSF
jgi:hypothetical protein